MDENKKLPWFIKPTRQFVYGAMAGFGAGVAVAALIPPAAGYAGYSVLAYFAGFLMMCIGGSLRWREDRKAILAKDSQD
jgi:hypothetical protein